MCSRRDRGDQRPKYYLFRCRLSTSHRNRKTENEHKHTEKCTHSQNTDKKSEEAEEIISSIISEQNAIINADQFLLPTREDLIKAQQADPKIQQIMKAMNTANTMPFFMKDGLMMRKTDNPHLFEKKRNKYDQVEQIYIPESENNWIRQTFKCMAHGLPLSGHDGVKRTIKKAERKYLWPNIMKEEIRLWCR
jgi:hypothetical protein